MRIAIIGAGNVGGALGRGAKAAGHEVVVAAAGPESAERLAGELGATAAPNNSDAVRDADVVVLAVPQSVATGVATEIAEAAAGKVVIDATNPMKPDFSGLSVTDRSGAELIQDQLPDSSVVKAFNTVFAANQAAGDVDGTTLDGFYAGDDAAAKKVVADLLTGIGYRPIDVGPLSQALALEHMAFLNIALNAGNNWPWRSGWKLVGPTG